MNKSLLVCLLGLLTSTVLFGSDSLLVFTVGEIPTVQKVEIAQETSKSHDFLTNAELSRRLVSLQEILAVNERKTGNWWKTWVVLYGAATVGQGAAGVLIRDVKSRQDLFLGAGTTLFGVAGQLITPIGSGFKASTFAGCENLSYTERLLKLAEAEAMLRKQAKVALYGKSWQAHALSGSVNLASGLITWLGFKRSFGEGLLNFALNTVVTEAQIWSQPIRAKKDYERYLRGLMDVGAEPARKMVPEWFAAVSPGGCCIGLSF
jgi:hypothetical protein